MSAVLVQSGTALNVHPTHTALGGFTLIELMVTLAVAAILLAVAIPSYQTMVMNNRQNSVVDAVTSALNYARNSALSGDRSITLCPNGGGAACGAGWNTGWIVTTAPAAPVVVLTTTALKAGGPTVKTNGGSVSMVFSARGLVNGSDTFVVCDSRGSAFGRAVMVNPVGFVQVSDTRGFAPDDITPLVCP